MIHVFACYNDSWKTAGEGDIDFKVTQVEGFEKIPILMNWMDHF